MKVEVGTLNNQGVAYFEDGENVAPENRLVYVSNSCEETLLAHDGEEHPTSAQEAKEIVAKLWGNNPDFLPPTR